MLEGVRVLDLVGGVAGSYCTKLFADAGADVVVVEPPGGRPTRRSGPPGLFEYLHTSKRSVTSGHEIGLLNRADIVVAGEGFAAGQARRAAPRQVVVTITAFGMHGPWVGRPANEFVLQAACGSTGGRGLPDGVPLSAGGRLGEWLAGTYAAVGALAAWMAAERCGAGDHVDVSVLDCMAIGMVTFPSVFAAFAAACGRPPATAAIRKVEVPSIEPTSDGWVSFTTNSAQQFSDFAVLIGHPELADDRRFARAGPRFAHRHEFWEMTRSYTRSRSSAEVIAEAAALRIPIAPVLDEASVLTFEQFAARRVFVDHPSGAFRQPRVPYRFDGRRSPPFGVVPRSGQHDGTVDWPERPALPVGDPGRLPLDGVRIVDVTSWWAGPCATHVLACLGADVIKVESTVRPDPVRFASVRGPGEAGWWEWGPLAHATNTNKRAVTADLSRPEGVDLALRLMAGADLVVENFTPRVIEQFGLGWDRLHGLNPRLNLVRMPAFGLDGPWRDRPGFAQTMEALTGLAAGTGFPDGSPVLVGGAGDPIAGLHAAFASLLALVVRDATGSGSMVESTMVEAVLNTAAAAPIAHQLRADGGVRRGNRSDGGSIPQGVYPCDGDDAWIAISVRSDDEWLGLTAVLGGPDGDGPTATGLPLGSAARRRSQEDALDRWLADRTRQWNAWRLADELVARGVPAAEVIPPPAVVDNPQITHRGLFETEDHPVSGLQLVPGLPFRMDRVHRWVRSPAPLLGEHNDQVLGELGIDERRRDELRAAGIIGESLADG